MTIPVYFDNVPGDGWENAPIFDDRQEVIDRVISASEFGDGVWVNCEISPNIRSGKLIVQRPYDATAINMSFSIGDDNA